MPDFDKNLQPIIKDNVIPGEDIKLKAPTRFAPMTFPDHGGRGDLSNSGDVFSELEAASKRSDFGEKGMFVTNATLDANKRYSTFNPTISNYEDFAAYGQSSWDKATNGVLKGLNLAATTIAGGFGMLYGTAKWALGGKFSDVYSNEALMALDKWNEKVDNELLPNYYTQAEKDSAWYSTNNWLTTNFLFDKLIKNAGFAVGAMYSGNLANAGLLRAGASLGKGLASLAKTAEASQSFKMFTPLLRNTARAFSAGKNAEAAAILEKEISSIADVTAKSSKLAEIGKSTNLYANFNDGARRVAVAAYSSAGEASFEALQTAKEFKENLIEKYKDDNLGAEPTGEALKNIEQMAEKVGMTSFFGNMALLSVTENAQLPKLLGSTYSSSRQAANSLLGRTDDVVVKGGKYAAKTPTTKFGKIYEKATGVGRYIFDYKEAGQELGQYALQVGTQNYFNKAYQTGDANAWVDGFLYGFVGKDNRGEDVGALVSKEGMESMLLGGITGGLMQAKANYKDAKSTASNTATFVDTLNNAPTFRDSFKDRLNSANRGIVLQQQQEDAILQGDKLEAMDLNADMMHNYLSTRIKYGRYDMVKEDIKELKEQGGSEQGLAELKKIGMANMNDTVASFQARLSLFESTANNVNELYKSFNIRFAGQLNEDGSPKYSPSVIDKMVYAASKVADYDTRIPSISTSLLEKDIDVQGVINDELTDETSNSLAETLNAIDKLGIIDKDLLKQNLKDAVELSKRRRMFLDEYNDIRDNPQNYDESGERKTTNEQGKKLRTIPSKWEDSPDGKNWATISRAPFKGDKRTYDDLVKQYGEGEMDKRKVLQALVDSPYATTMEKELAKKFLDYVPKGSKIVMGDRSLPNPGVSRSNYVNEFAAVSTINYEYNADDYEGVTVPVEHVILHEIAHDLTTFGLMNESDPFYNEITPLYNFVQDYFKNDPNKYAEAGLIRNGEFYAFKNVKEFVAEALSNRDFQRYLATIPYKNTQKSVWDNFVDNLKTFFRRLFGITEENALEEAVAIISNNVDRIYKSTKEKNQKLAEEEEKLRQSEKLTEQLNNEQTSIETKSGDVSTGDPSTETYEYEDPKKDIKILFDSSTTESEGNDQTPADLTKSAPHVQRSREFLNNAKNLKNRKNLRAIVVTPNQEKGLGLEGLTALSYKATAEEAATEEFKKKVTDLETGFVAQVFVEQQGSDFYYINKNGERIGKVGEPVDLNQVIFQTMPTTSLTWSETFGGAKRHRSTQADVAEAYQNGWRTRREELFNAPDGTFKPYQFKISRGIPYLGTDNNFIGETLVPEQVIENQQVLKVSTVGTIQFNGPEGVQNLNYPVGRPVLVYGDTVQPVNNKNLSKNQTETLYEVIKQIADGIREKGTINRRLAKFVQNVLFWKSKIAGSKTNQIRVDAKSKMIYIGDKAFSVVDVADSKAEIIEQLSKAYHNINNTSLTTDFVEKFTEFYMEDGELKEREWTNYQSYLMSSIYPDGSKRTIAETPLTTNVLKATDAVPFSYKQKYSTLVDFEIPVQIVKKEEAPKAEVKPAAEPLKTDGTTPNTYLGLGKERPVQYTVNKDAEGNYNVEVDGNQQVIKDIAAKADVMKATIIPFLNKQGVDISQDDNVLAAQFVAFRISAELKAQEAKKQEAPPAPVVEPAPVSTDAKADIEAAYSYITTRKYEGDRRDQVNKVGEDLAKRFVATLKERGLVKEDYRMAPRTDGSVERMKVNTDAEGNNLGNDWSTAGKFKDEFRKFIDAELAALEGAKPAEAPKPEGPTGPIPPVDNSGFKEPDDAYRKVGVGEAAGERMTDEDIEVFKKFVKKNAPGIPYEILENIITTIEGEKAWGMLEKGVAKFVKGGLKGTEYHELFEGIWKYFVPASEKQAILDEFKSKEGVFVDRETGREIDYANATDQQAKERIADDFADYRVGKLKPKSVGERLRRIFKAILEFFNVFGKDKSLKTKLFKEISKGRFKEATLPETVVFDTTPEYKKVPGLTEIQKQEFVDDMLSRVGVILFGERSESIFNINKLTGKEIFGKIEQFYVSENKRQAMADETWNGLVQETKDKMRSLFKITLEEDEIVSINDEDRTRQDYAPEPFSVDYKKNSPYSVRLTIGTLPATERITKRQEGDIQRPKRKTSKFAMGLKLVNFSRMFGTLLNKMSNTFGVNKFANKLEDLARTDSDFVRLFFALGGRKDGGIDFSNFKLDDWRLFIQHYQVFTKQNPTAVVQYVDGSETYSASSAISAAASEVKRGWIQNIRDLSKVAESAIKYDRTTKSYKIKDIKSIPIGSEEEQLKFLDKIGFTFPKETYNLLTEEGKEDFAGAVSGIRSNLEKADAVMTLTNKTLDISGHLNTLAELMVKADNPNVESTRFNIEKKRTGNFADNNAPSLFENEFNEVATLNELLALRPELNDVFSANSIYLKKGGPFFDKFGNRTKAKLKVMYIEGTNNLNKGKGTKSSKLNLVDRYMQEINQNINGNYYILIPGDGSTEWMMNLGNPISYLDVQDGKAVWNKVNNIFKGYLMDEIALAKDASNREKLANVGKKAKQLRFFNEILPLNILEGIDGLIADSADEATIKAYLTDNKDAIETSIKGFVESTVAATRSTLADQSALIETVDNFALLGLDTNFTNNKDVKLDHLNMTNEEVNNVLTLANVNYIINNIEYHKLIFGDPYQFKITDKKGKIILDETKRIKSFLSPRRTTFDSPELNDTLNDDLNKVGDISLTSKDYGYHLHKPYLNTATFSDVNVVGSSVNTNPAYAKVNEADAASWIIDVAYRETMVKNGQWDMNTAEPWHQWELAYTRNKLAAKDVYTYSNEALRKQDEQTISKPSPKHVISVIKPIVSGVKYGKSYLDNVLDKFSQMPIYYSAVEGTNLEELYIKMFNENIDYVIMESGRKVGIEEKHNVYTSGGQFNSDKFNNLIQVPWKAYGIQVETGYEGETGQTRGSQGLKVPTVDLFDNGEPTSEEAKKAVNRYTRAIDMMHDNGYNMLLKKLGIEDLGDSFRVVDPSKVSQSLEYEMLRRELSSNAKDTIRRDPATGEFIIPFEASTSYKQITDILYSMVNKSIASPKLNGGGYVEVPVTMWEKSGTSRKLAVKEYFNNSGKEISEKEYDDLPEDMRFSKWRKISSKEYEDLSQEKKKKIALTDDTLKFYTKEDPYCEIMLPHWFKEKLSKKKFPNDQAILDYLNGTKEGQEILRGVGFRIPTQKPSSMETFRVKGFLPQYMGKTVVVPSEITTKAGSDFDIDKLNTYLKNIYIDKNGDIKLVRYLGSEEETRKFFGKVFDEKLEKKKITKAEFNEVVDIFLNNKPDPKGLFEEYADFLDVVFADVENPSEYENKIRREFDRLNDATLQAKLKEEFVDKMHEKAIENEYFSSLEQLLTLPENFENLISPVDDAGLSDEADDINRLRGVDKVEIKNRMLDRNYLTTQRHNFVMSKKWVGIVAVNITNHSLTQKSKVYIDPARLKKLNPQDAKFIGDGSIKLRHNTVTINGVERPSMSGKLNQAGQSISNRLSGYGSAVVDVVKDPFIMDIVYSDKLISVAMFMERMGIANVGLFLNQPIVRKYVEFVDSSKSYMYNSMNIQYIKSFFAATNDALTGEINEGNLADNISSYAAGELNNFQNGEQQAILDEFLKYAKMSEQMFDFTQAINYDTTKFNNRDSLYRKQVRTRLAVSSNIFCCVSNVLKSTYLGKQSALLDKSSESMGSILKLDQDVFTVITDRVLYPYAANKYTSADEYARVAGRVRASFLDYIVQTKGAYNLEINQLLTEKSTSVASRLQKAQEQYGGELAILNQLVVESAPGINSPRTIKLRANLKEAYDEDLHIGYMRELRDSGIPGMKELYDDIVKVALLQGTYQSAVSIKNIVPVEDYASLISPIIKPLVSNEDLNKFVDLASFERNLWKTDDVFETFEPKFTKSEHDLPVEIDTEIYQYFADYTNFPKVEGFVQSSERKILEVSTTHNFVESTKKFLKIPRVVNVWVYDKKAGKRVKVDNADMKDGKSVTAADFKRRSLKGDSSLYDVYGYQKVTFPDGTPLTRTKKYIVNNKEVSDTVHVYRQINLWGDGQYLAEHYDHATKSAVENGSVTVAEIANDDVIRAYERAFPTTMDKPATDYELTQSSVSEEVIQEVPKELAPSPTEKTFVEIAVPKKAAKKTEFQSKSVDGNVETKKGYKVIIPEYPEVSFYITKDIHTQEGIMESKSWEVQEEKTSRVFPTTSTTIQGILEDIQRVVNQQLKLKTGREVLESVGFKPSGTAAPASFETAFSPERQTEIVKNFSEKYKLSEEEAIRSIKYAIESKGQSAIDKLNECY